MVAGLPELVGCERTNLKLLADSCARFWRSSNPVAPPVWQGRVSCHGCPAGAARAGVELDPIQAARDRLGHVCTRCRRTSDRIIRREFCPSCYNRNLELLRGKNRKGVPPVRVASSLFPTKLVAVESGSAEIVERTACSGALELVLSRARRAKAPVVFGWAPRALEAA